MKHLRGFTLLEVTVAVAVFGIFLFMITTLSAELRAQEKRNTIDFMRHPQVIAMLARLRRDVLDASKTATYPPDFSIGGTTYTQDHDLLIVNTFVGGGQQTVVWDFRKPGEVHRISYNVGVATEWVARGLPDDMTAEVDAVETSPNSYGVEFKAKDGHGRLVIDQYLLPRAHD